jgi:hypothetical protein
MTLRFIAPVIGLIACTLATAAEQTPLTRLIDQPTLKLLAEEISGEAAKRNLDTITLWHRTRASSQFQQAAEHILSQLQEYGFADARIMTFPADGKTLFGTQKSRPAWDVESAELWEINADGKRIRRLADWSSMPLSVAQDSLSGQVKTTLVDIGPGTEESHYYGLDLRGKLVLTDSQPRNVVNLAIVRFGAAGIVSYAPNQKSAWWKQDDRLVRWGHLSSFPDPASRTFGFMISLGEARRLKQRLASGETIHLDARVDANHSTGSYALTTAVIPGVDPKDGDEEILFTCHLDHPRPGANDNASGCVSILETARALRRLIDRGLLPAPRRSLRFIWPAEIEGTLIYLNAHPELAAKVLANVHMDMVGGNPDTKSVFRISGGPLSLPSFVADLGHAVGQFVNAQTLAHTSGEPTDFPLVAPEGGKEPLLAVMEGLSMGSDHDVLHEGSWRVPGIYLHDWPDRYIHTNFDTAANIDPTKLKRSAFIGAVTAWFLANMTETDVPAVLALLQENALKRTGELLTTRAGLDLADASAVTRVHWAAESMRLDSLSPFASPTETQRRRASDFLAQLEQLSGPAPDAARPVGDHALVYQRNPNIKGPMHAFGFSYLEDRLSQQVLKTLDLPGDQAYETLNLVNGTRTVGDIRDWLTAEFGPVDVQAVARYLQALESIGVIDVLRR